MIEHCQTKAHVEKVITKRTNYSLPTAAENTDAYGLHPMFASQLFHTESFDERIKCPIM